MSQNTLMIFIVTSVIFNGIMYTGVLVNLGIYSQLTVTVILLGSAIIFKMKIDPTPRKRSTARSTNDFKRVKSSTNENSVSDVEVNDMTDYQVNS